MEIRSACPYDDLWPSTFKTLMSSVELISRCPLLWLSRGVWAATSFLPAASTLISFGQYQSQVYEYTLPVSWTQQEDVTWVLLQSIFPRHIWFAAGAGEKVQKSGDLEEENNRLWWEVCGER